VALCAWRVPELAREARSLLRRRSTGARLAGPAAAAES